MAKITFYIKEERALIDKIDRAKQKRLLEEDYIRVTAARLSSEILR